MLDQHAHDDSTSDRDLITLTATGDHLAFERLVARHAAAVLRLATVVTGDPVTAEDALQQAFLSAFRNAAYFTRRGARSHRRGRRARFRRAGRNRAIRFRFLRASAPSDRTHESALDCPLRLTPGTPG
ncbi:MAG: hypothetical protein JRJ80_15005 [Deltaproteobacteria bacterium]|nr:hypothetical protein [Deltaproteobacteria bacterium]